MTMRETLRKLTIQITFTDCCSELVQLKVPSDVTDEQIRKELTVTNQKLFEDEIKPDIEWIENCPLPENEVFMRIGRNK